MEKKINLLFTMNRDYVMPCIVALTSIFENDKDGKFNVFMLHSGIGDIERQRIKELEDKYKQNITEIEVDHNYFQGINYGRWSKELWYRLLVEEYIPQDLDRIFNLDCDIIVTGDLKKFYNTDFEDKYLIAPYFDDAISVENNRRLGFSRDYIYFPSAFLVYNLDKMRSELNYPNLIKNIDKYKEILKFPEMDLLNLMFHDRVKIVSKDLYYIGDDRPFRKGETPSIIHFSASKPWHNLIRGKYEDIWLKYLRLSPYSYLYDEKYNNLKTKLLRSIPGKFIIRTFFGTNVFTILDRVLPKKIHNHLRKSYRKYFK